MCAKFVKYLCSVYCIICEKVDTNTNYATYLLMFYDVYLFVMCFKNLSIMFMLSLGLSRMVIFWKHYSVLGVKSYVLDWYSWLILEDFTKIQCCFFLFRKTLCSVSLLCILNTSSWLICLNENVLRFKIPHTYLSKTVIYTCTKSKTIWSFDYYVRIVIH